MSIKRFSTGSISSPTPKNSKLWDQETFPGTFESIASAVVDASGASSIDFTNIPQNYTHLQIRVTARTTYAGSGLNNIVLRFNDDGGTNYNYHILYGNGSTTSSGNNGSGFTQAQAYFGTSMPQASATANVFGVYIVDVLDYKNTNKIKTIRSLNGADLNGSGTVALWANLWNSTAAINRITFYTDANFAQYSNISIYGIRG